MSEKLKIREIRTSSFLSSLPARVGGASLLCFLKAVFTDELFLVTPAWI